MAEKRRLAVWHLESRKKPCLMVLEGNRATKIASFNNVESAQLFVEIINNLIRDNVYPCREYSNKKEDKEAWQENTDLI